MFRQFSYRLIPFVLGLVTGGFDRRGRRASAEVTDPGTGPDTGPGTGPGLDSDFDPPDRGDVPGWVLITLMTAGLVVALWALAGEAFTSMFQDAMNKVRGAG